MPEAAKVDQQQPNPGAYGLVLTHVIGGSAYDPTYVSDANGEWYESRERIATRVAELVKRWERRKITHKKACGWYVIYSLDLETGVVQQEFNDTCEVLTRLEINAPAQGQGVIRVRKPASYNSSIAAMLADPPVAYDSDYVISDQPPQTGPQVAPQWPAGEPIESL